MSKNSPGYVVIMKPTERIYINDEQYFDNVPLVAWEFYILKLSACSKWLKEEINLNYPNNEIANHYQK